LRRLRLGAGAAAAPASGVSTDALIAPFAFLGDDASIERIVQLYRDKGYRVGP
jgi:hypothetical protein